MIREKEGVHSDGKTIGFMRENGKMVSNMESAYSLPKME